MTIARLATAWIAMAVLGGVRVSRAEPQDLPVPPVSTPSSSVVRAPVELPGVPRFELPRLAGGVHDVRELRVRGHALLDRELTVQGYVTWIYDCAKALAKPGVPAEETRLLIEDNPQLCEIPKFYLGPGAHAAPEVALWVVDVPRAANKREKIALRETQLLRRPAVPKIALGDLVAVTGTFTRRSPHGEQSSDGLLVFEKLAHVTPETYPRAIATPSSRIVLEAPVPARPSPGAAVSMRDRNESIERYERCNQLLVARRFEDAARECRRALERWSANHLAWYALGNIQATQEDWCAARDAYAHAVRLRPDAAMYQLYAGVASFQLGARGASREGRSAARCSSEAVSSLGSGTVAATLFKPYLLAVAPSEPADAASLDFARARAALAIAARLAPQLWPASYYLGKAALQQELADVAAEAFGQSIRADPAQADPYTALLQLYRSWGFLDLGLVVARQAEQHATTGDLARLFYEVGMAYQAMQDDAAALAAFSKAVAGRNAPARLQRGQIYLRRGDVVKAKLDLEAFLAEPDPGLGFAKQIARSLLVAIAHKAPEDDVYLRLPRHYENQ